MHFWNEAETGRRDWLWLGDRHAKQQVCMQNTGPAAAMPRLLHSLLEARIELEAGNERLRVGAQVARVAYGLRRDAVQGAERDPARLRPRVRCELGVVCDAGRHIAAEQAPQTSACAPSMCREAVYRDGVLQSSGRVVGAGPHLFPAEQAADVGGDVVVLHHHLEHLVARGHLAPPWAPSRLLSAQGMV